MQTSKSPPSTCGQKLHSSLRGRRAVPCPSCSQQHYAFYGLRIQSVWRLVQPKMHNSAVAFSRNAHSMYMSSKTNAQQHRKNDYGMSGPRSCSIPCVPSTCPWSRSDRLLRRFRAGRVAPGATVLSHPLIIANNASSCRGTVPHP